MDENMILWFVLGLTLITAIYTLFLVRFFLKKTAYREKLEVLSKYGTDLFKLRLQAYERLTLLLERILPESLILREQSPKMSALAFHSHLLKMVRHEFNHNLAMQIYITAKTWNKIKTARDQLLVLINSSAAKTNPESSAIELGKTIIEDASYEVNYHITEAVNAIRDEMEYLYRM
ncbi:MAG: hypothetical protein LBV41_10410 [Cytophagaceae bacterium]|jgi:hypothetical protein|nr:hypothetical protein [Cytophagaceae bacterium]